MANNNSFLFYRKYFEANSPHTLQRINNEIYESPIQNIGGIFKDNPSVLQLSTTYPGLLIGSGYGHDYKHDNAELKNEAFKIGFFFDFTTGMPIIPGSSIKGMLRSCFPQKSVKTKKLSPEYKNSRIQFIKEIITNELKIFSEINIDALEDEIFHGLRDNKPIPIYERDIFIDAVPTSVHNTKGNLFDDDYITPHIQELKNPEPLKFLKVSSNVQFRFEFRLFDSKICSDLTADKKLELFKYLILTLGLGAKTNVGYGQFVKEEESMHKSNSEDIQKSKLLADLNKIIEKQAEAEKYKSEADKRLVIDADIECAVIEKDKKYYYFGVDWDKDLKFSKQISKVNEVLNVNDKVIIHIVADYYPTKEVKFNNNVKKA